MTDVNMEQEIQRLVDETKDEIEEAQQPRAGVPIVDVGADTMTKAGDLAAQAMRESFAETAKRVLAVGERIMQEAIEKDKYCKELADMLIENGAMRADEFINLFERNRNASIGLNEIKHALNLVKGSKSVQ